MISYLITCSTETDTLDDLLKRLYPVLIDGDEGVILVDEETRNAETDCVIDQYSDRFQVHYHALDRNYGEHKNAGIKLCNNPWIMQLDGDELPSENIVGENLREIIEANNVELIFVPRVNDYLGVTEEDAKVWGWRLSRSPMCDNRLIVQWPDYQGRIHKRLPDRIKWDRRLHEKIVGHTSYAKLPAEEEYALHHRKSMTRQREVNFLYNKLFSQEENKGHGVF